MRRPTHRLALRRFQGGTTAVEFAIVGAVTLLLIFGVLEVSRMMFARGLLEEAVRRGARLAAVCPVNDPYIATAAVYAAGGGNSSLLRDLAPAHLRVEYLGANGTVLADPMASYTQIEFVRTRIQNFSLPLIIPFMNLIFQPTQIRSTLPRESLGLSEAGVTAC